MLSAVIISILSMMEREYSSWVPAIVAFIAVLTTWLQFDCTEQKIAR